MQLQSRQVPADLTMRVARPGSSLGIATPDLMMMATPNPVTNRTRITYRLTSPSAVQILISDAQGRTVKVLANTKQEAGTYNLDWDASNAAKGFYFISILKNGEIHQTIKVLKG